MEQSLGIHQDLDLFIIFKQILKWKLFYFIFYFSFLIFLFLWNIISTKRDEAPTD